VLASFLPVFAGDVAILDFDSDLSAEYSWREIWILHDTQRSKEATIFFHFEKSCRVNYENEELTETDKFIAANAQGTLFARAL
jgi:hypothetical protein